MSIEPFPVFGSIDVFARAAEEIVATDLASHVGNTGRGQVIFQNRNLHFLLFRKVHFTQGLKDTVLVDRLNRSRHSAHLYQRIAEDRGKTKVETQNPVSITTKIRHA
jgi:hypothetical protein